MLFRSEVLKQVGYKTAVVCIIEDLDEVGAKRLAAEISETRFPVNPEAMGKMLEKLRQHFGEDDLLKTVPMTSAQLQSAIDAALTQHRNYNPEKKTRRNSTAGKGTGKTIVITVDEPLDHRWNQARQRIGGTAQTTFNTLLEAYAKN